MSDLERDEYVRRYGPDVGDRIHLADTGLVLEVAESAIPKGEESVIGAGKNLREGMGVYSGTHPEGLDAVVLNALVVDPVIGVVKADIGLRDGHVVGVGNAGNPDVAEITEGLVVDTATSIVHAAGMIATPAGIDSHVHMMAPRLIEAAINSGITTLIAMGAGPFAQARTDPEHLVHAIRSIEEYPVNVGFLGQGSNSDPRSAREFVEAGMCGLKLHEDHAAYPDPIDNALSVCEEYDVQLAYHTDSINESGHLETTLGAIADRVGHAFHVEGAGGGHIPDLLEVVEHDYVLPSSTNPTNPHTPITEEEHVDMTMTVHNMKESIEADVEFAEKRIRGSTMAAEDVLHDLGAISMMNSDSMGMGRVFETISSTWQVAAKMKQLSGDSGPDNERVLRYLAKYTINPAITQGIDDYVGSLEPGKLADVVLWEPAFFGAKPAQVIKGGMIVGGPIGNENGSTTGVEPVQYKPNFGWVGTAPGPISLLFTSEHAARRKTREDLGTTRLLAPVGGTRELSKADMVRNDATPDVDVDPSTHEVRIGGEPVAREPVTESALAQRYFLH